MSVLCALDLKFNRYVPKLEWHSGEESRWLLARELGFGEGSSIYANSYVYGLDKLKVGRNTWVGCVVLDATGGLEIGDNCSISMGVHIYSHDTVRWALSGGVEKYSYAAVLIGDNCHIGDGSVICKGVHIPSGHIVPALSKVTVKNVGDVIVKGVLAKEVSE